MSIIWVIEGGGSDRQNQSLYGFFFKIPSLPVSTTTLFDIFSPTNGYHRIVLTTGGLVRQQDSWPGGRATIDASLTGATAISLNTWYWVSGSDIGDFFVANNELVIGQVSGFSQVTSDTGRAHTEPQIFYTVH